MLSVPHTQNCEELDLVRAPSGLASLEDFLKSHTSKLSKGFRVGRADVATALALASTTA